MNFKSDLQQRMKCLSLILGIPVLAVVTSLPVLAEDGYSFEEEQACAGDAFRLCANMIPDIPKITACMEAKKDQLSPKCARMFQPGRDRGLNEGEQ